MGLGTELKKIGKALAPVAAIFNPIAGAALSYVSTGGSGSSAFKTYFGGVSAGGQDVVGAALKDWGVIGEGTILGDIADTISGGNDKIKDSITKSLGAALGLNADGTGQLNLTGDLGQNSMLSMMLNSYFADKSADKQTQALSEAAKLQADAARYAADLTYNMTQKQLEQNEAMFNKQMDLYTKQYNQARSDQAPWLNLGRAAVAGLSDRLFKGPNLTDIRLQPFKFSTDIVGDSLAGKSAFGQRNVMQGYTGFDEINPADYGISNEQLQYQGLQGDYSGITPGASGTAAQQAEAQKNQAEQDAMVQNITSGNIDLLTDREISFAPNAETENVSPYLRQMDTVINALVSEIDDKKTILDKLSWMTVNGVIDNYWINNDGSIGYKGKDDYYNPIYTTETPDKKIVVGTMPYYADDTVSITYPAFSSEKGNTSFTIPVKTDDLVAVGWADDNTGALLYELPDGTKLLYDKHKGQYTVDPNEYKDQDPRWLDGFWIPDEYKNTKTNIFRDFSGSSNDLINVSDPQGYTYLLPKSTMQIETNQDGYSIAKDAKGNIYSFTTNVNAIDGASGSWVMGAPNSSASDYVRKKNPDATIIPTTNLDGVKTKTPTGNMLNYKKHDWEDIPFQSPATYEELYLNGDMWANINGRNVLIDSSEIKKLSDGVYEISGQKYTQITAQDNVPDSYGYTPGDHRTHRALNILIPGDPHSESVKSYVNKLRTQVDFDAKRSPQKGTFGETAVIWIPGAGKQNGLIKTSDQAQIYATSTPSSSASVSMTPPATSQGFYTPPKTISAQAIVEPGYEQNQQLVSPDFGNVSEAVAPKSIPTDTNVQMNTDGTLGEAIGTSAFQQAQTPNIPNETPTMGPEELRQNAIENLNQQKADEAAAQQTTATTANDSAFSTPAQSVQTSDANNATVIRPTDQILQPAGTAIQQSSAQYIPQTAQSQTPATQSAFAQTPQTQSVPGASNPYQIDERGLVTLADGTQTDYRMLPFTQNLADDSRYQEWANWVYEQSPAYKYRMDEANRAIQQSAAARGNVLSGATMKDLQKNAQGLAAQDYNMERALADSRMMDAYNMNRQREADAAMRRAAGLGEFWDQYGAAQNAYQQAMNEFQQSYNNMSGAAGMGQGTAAQSAGQAMQYGQNSANNMNAYAQGNQALNMTGTAALAQGATNAAQAMADATAQIGNVNANKYQDFASIYKQNQQGNAAMNSAFGKNERII